MTQPTSTPFVGEDRQRLLEELQQVWDEVKGGEGARLVTLAAPTGWGKTRVIQELYGRLVSEGGGGYWPASMQVPDTSWLQARKRVFPPPFDVREGTTIPFLWLGVSCQKDQMGRRLAALQYAEEQFQAHVGPMARALAERGERWKARLGAVGAVAGLFGLPDPVQMAMTWHGIARSTWDLVSGEWSVFQSRRRGHAARHVDTEGLESAAERARELGEQLGEAER